MLDAIQMMFSPGPVWFRMVDKTYHWLALLFLVLIPALLVGSGIETFMLNKFGERTSDIGMMQPTAERIYKYEGVHAVTSLASVALGAIFLGSVAASFNVRATYSQSFAVLAYAYAPILLMHAFDGIPRLNTWICWGTGLLLGWRILYHGVAVGLKPEQTKGFGVFLFSVVFLTALSGFSHLVSVMVLRGKLWP